MPTDEGGLTSEAKGPREPNQDEREQYHNRHRDVYDAHRALRFRRKLLMTKRLF